MAENPINSTSGIENSDENAPFEIPGLFSEIEGITSQINSPFEEGNQLIPVEAVLDKLEDTSIEFSLGPLPNESLDSEGHEGHESRSSDVCDYVQMLECPELFADPEQTRKELETEFPEMQDDDNLEDPVTLPELFKNATDSYQDMFSAATENLFSGSESEDVQGSSDEHKPLYRNAPLTVSESLLLVITFAIRYTLSGSALNDLLILISLHCINPNLCRKSLHQFQHFFRSIKNPLVYHRYCSYCFLLVDDRATKTCPNPLCSRDLTRSNSCAFFIEIPIVAQVRNLFAKSGFYDNLGHRF